MTDTRVPLLFVDLETTCLDERSPDARILEVGVALTSPDLDVIERASWVVPFDTSTVRWMMGRADEWVLAQHSTSGLWDACTAACDGSPRHSSHLGGLIGVWEAAEEWMIRHAPDAAIPLTGSSVHFDYRWLREFNSPLLKAVDPETGGYVNRTHRLPDSSSTREWLARWAPHIVAGAPGGRKLHRVDPDIEDSIEEARYYRDALGLAPVAPRPFTDADATWVRRCIASVAYRDDDEARLIAEHGADLLRHYGYQP